MEIVPTSMVSNDRDQRRHERCTEGRGNPILTSEGGAGAEVHHSSIVDCEAPEPPCCHIPAHRPDIVTSRRDDPRGQTPPQTMVSPRRVNDAIKLR